ncbi:MAG: hypothetical protein LBC20_11690, partial [Planctomycetaceae bacterium]|nr:hypothetical protein [Planctomycetaceae bacterium]
ITFYLSGCTGKRMTVISKKPYKIRSLKMENVLNCLVGFLGIFWQKILLLKRVSQVKQGGGGRI